MILLLHLQYKIIMMKIALFGGSGRIGQHFLKQALDSGHEVIALVRNPEKINANHPNLTIIKGDILNQKDVEKTIKDSEISVSLFGHSFGNLKSSAKGLQTAGTENIISAMQTYGLKRIISLSGGALPFPAKDKPKFADKLAKFIMKLAVPKVLNDAESHLDVLQKSGLEWIIIRGARFIDIEKTGNYRIGWVGVNSGMQIGRADLAEFVINQLDDDTFNYQMPFISY